MSPNPFCHSLAKPKPNWIDFNEVEVNNEVEVENDVELKNEVEVKYEV